MFLNKTKKYLIIHFISNTFQKKGRRSGKGIEKSRKKSVLMLVTLRKTLSL